MCFISDDIKILKTGFKEVSVAFLWKSNHEHSWCICKTTMYSMYACKCFCPIVATVHTTAANPIPFSLQPEITQQTKNEAHSCQPINAE